VSRPMSDPTLLVDALVEAAGEAHDRDGFRPDWAREIIAEILRDVGGIRSAADDPGKRR
jgi:hypothetical protein